jgi:hypothetical protein
MGRYDRHYGFAEHDGYADQSPDFTALDRVRPGMGLYNRNTHAMLIIDILWKSGVPVAFQVAEANYSQLPHLKSEKRLEPRPTRRGAVDAGGSCPADVGAR